MAIENDVSSLGKTYRFMSSFFPIDNRRKGKCKRCGRCCRMTNCKLLEFDNGGNALCPIHKIRPLQCRKYPRSKKNYLHILIVVTNFISLRLIKGTFNQGYLEIRRR